jgi:hypothetical protein
LSFSDGGPVARLRAGTPVVLLRGGITAPHIARRQRSTPEISA